MTWDGTIRPYEASDADALWSLKRAFELGLGDGTGGAEKRAKYEQKLTEEYRQRYLDWVDGVVVENEQCVLVADDGDGLVGYGFLLPESLSMIWDAAVLNEVFVRPAYRGTGVADELVGALFEVARAQDLPLDRIVLDVDRANERARAFYRRHGFEHWGEMLARDLDRNE